MQKEIHPPYYPAAAVTCSCGNKFAVGSTMEKLHVEICSACHPFFSGQEKIIDSAGRVEKFKQRQKRQVNPVRSSRGALNPASAKNYPLSSPRQAAEYSASNRVKVKKSK